MEENELLEWHAEHGLGSHRTGATSAILSMASPSAGREGVPDMLMQTSEVCKQFGIKRDRVAKIARARKWRYVSMGQGKPSLWYRADVQEEAARRIEKGLKG